MMESKAQIVTPAAKLPGYETDFSHSICQKQINGDHVHKSVSHEKRLKSIRERAKYGDKDCSC